MSRSLTSLIGHRIRAIDGEVGRVDDLLFDNKTWGMAYLVARIGGIFGGTRVLLPPTALGKPDSRGIPVVYSKEQVSHCPGADVDLPIPDSEQKSDDASLMDELLAGSLALAAIPMLYPMPFGIPSARHHSDVEDLHLLSLRDVIGYHIQATDGVLGHADDVLVDDVTWGIVAIIVKMSGKSMQLLPKDIARIVRREEKIYVNTSMEQLKVDLRVSTFVPNNYANIHAYECYP